VYGDDPVTPQDEGAKDGDVLTFILNNSYELRVDSLPYATNNSQQLELHFLDEYLAALGNGWNLISFNYQPQNPSMPGVISSLNNSFDFVKSFEPGYGTRTWDIHRPPQLNDLLEMDAFHGYWIHLTQADQLRIKGTRQRTNTPLILSNGWNLISYLPPVADSLFHSFASIDTNYQFVKGFINGVGAISWDRNRPAFLNDLLILEPGRGYWVLMSSPDTLIYPLGDYRSGSNLDFIPDVLAFEENLPSSPISCDYWGIASTVNGQPIPAGSQISFKDNDGILCGICEVAFDGAYLIHVMGDDPLTTEVDEGATSGEQLNVFVDDQFAGISLPFVENGSQLFEIEFNFSGLKEENSNIPKVFKLLPNYPNPFNPVTTIEFHLPTKIKISLSVYDVLGKKVKDLIYKKELQPGIYKLQWDGLDRWGRPVGSGIYIVRFCSNKYNSVQKMILLK